MSEAVGWIVVGVAMLVALAMVDSSIDDQVEIAP